MIPKLISGGQTGADQAALDFALAHHLPYGGWCPGGRRAEDAPIADCYQLRETPSEEYTQRTEWNVRDSDGTVIFSLATILVGGSAYTAEYARQLGKPLLHLTPAESHPARLLRDFVTTRDISTLNVAGPRASEEPAVGAFVWRVLEEAFIVPAKVP
jgi:hypothetical protein